KSCNAAFSPAHGIRSASRLLCRCREEARSAMLRSIFVLILGVRTVKFCSLWIAGLSVFLTSFLMLGFADRDGIRAQGLVPWRQGIMQPYGDAGLRFMAAEGGFAARQGLGLRMVPFDNEALMFKALMGGEIETLEGS